jgi:hypothetical protein
MAFGGPLLNKKVQMAIRFKPIEEIIPLLRTLGYIKPKETIITIPIKEVLKSSAKNSRG